MHNKGMNDGVYDKLTNELMTYTLVNWKTPGKRLKTLKNYIKKTKDFDVELNELGKLISKTRFEIGRPLELTDSKAVYITRDKEIEILKFGSANCPRCSNYKNYFRDCPHCGYFEF